MKRAHLLRTLSYDWIEFVVPIKHFACLGLFSSTDLVDLHTSEYTRVHTITQIDHNRALAGIDR